MATTGRSDAAAPWYMQFMQTNSLVPAIYALIDR